MFRIFAHLQRRSSSGIFYFRLTVPSHLRHSIGRREIKKSLGTSLRADAILKAQLLYLETRNLFSQEEKRMSTSFKKTKPASAADILADLENFSARHTSPDGSISKIILSVGGQDVTIERENPKEEAEIAAKLLNIASSSPAPTPPKGRLKKDSTISLSKMVSLYFDEVKQTETQQPKTIEENMAIFQLLIDFAKNPAAEIIGIKTATDFKATLLRLPPNRTKGRYSGKSVAEILRMRPSKTMANESVNKYLRRISALFDWGKRHGHVHENPFSGLSIRRTKLPHQERERFTIEELQRLFDPAQWNRNMRKSYMYWLPVLGLHTGTRLNELCQLHLDDIRQEGDIWVLDINTQGENKRVKTLSSKRVVPIHPYLEKIGFLEHVDYLRQSGEKRLFPELKHQRDGYGQIASKWFARYRERLGIKKTFHSLRHTFVDELLQLGVDSKMVGDLVGHAQESETTSRYGKPFRPDVLYPVVCMLDFHIGNNKTGSER